MRPDKKTAFGRSLFVSFVLFTVFSPSVAAAQAKTDYFALDEAAIAVKAPQDVFLDAIARAGNRLVAVGEHGVITYSDDNGKTWRQASVPVDATLTAVTFADPQHGWAVGNSGVILYTQNAGKSWSLQLNGLEVNQLDLAAAKAAVADHSKAVGTPLAVRRAHILLSQGPSKPFLCILVQSTKKVLVFGAYRIAVATDNAGKTWQDASLRIGDPVSHHLYGVAVVHGDIFLVAEAGLVFRSTDGGKSFPELPVTAGSATLFGVTGTGDGGVLVYGVAGMMFRSTNLGQSWTQIAMPHSADITDVLKLADGTLVAAEESGELYISTNQGISFKPAPMALPMAVFALAQAANGQLVVTGNRGIMVLPAMSAGGKQPE